MTAHPGYTAATQAALAQLRDPSHFQWTIIFTLVLVVYLYAGEVHAGRTRVVAAGLALWFADWINELLNSAFLHLNGVAPFWVETGPTAYQILVGLNAETTMMFLLQGLVYAKMLPADRRVRFLGMDARLVVGVVMSLLCVAVELVLNAIGVLPWHWSFWDVPWGLPFIFGFGYLWFFLAAAWAHDAPTERACWTRVGTLAAVAVGLGVVFGLAGWL